MQKYVKYGILYCRLFFSRFFGYLQVPNTSKQLSFRKIFLSFLQKFLEFFVIFAWVLVNLAWVFQKVNIAPVYGEGEGVNLHDLAAFVRLLRSFSCWIVIVLSKWYPQIRVFRYFTWVFGKFCLSFPKILSFSPLEFCEIRE